jgi:hypothetical protein
MEGDAPQAPVTQEAQPEVNKVAQAPQQPADDSPETSETTSPPKPKKSKAKKVVIFLILIPILGAIAYGIFIAITYWKCSKTTPQACETNTCGFSLSGFSLTTEMKDNCCGNKTCEIGETNSVCATDCPNCDDGSECTEDSYNYNSQQCVHEQLYAPCHVRSIALSPATPDDDYQVNVRLTSSNFDYLKTKASGEDIRFIDENDNLLHYWIEDWNKEGESSVWVRIEDLGTDKIYMYHGYSDASSASDAQAVFNFYEGFDYESEGELAKVWSKHGSPKIELSDGIVTISTSGSSEEHGGQYISKNVGADILINNIVEMSVKRFSGGSYQNHMANIGYTSSIAGAAGESWALLRHNPSPDGGIVVFGSNHGGVAPPPVGSFNTIKIYHQDGVSYAYEPPGTKIAQYSWPMGEPPPGRDYVLLGGTTYQSGFGKASYDWIRIRKYASNEPSATLGDEESADEESTIKELY